jgi:hypothetical protein
MKSSSTKDQNITMASASEAYCFGCLDKTKPLKLCSGCRCLEFCGQECQKKVWKDHKHFCKAATAADCLILDGMGALGGGDFLTEAVQKSLQEANQSMSTVNVSRGRSMPAQLSLLLTERASDFKTCLILGWGSGDETLAREFGSSALFREALVTWVKERGGRLLIHGERIQTCCGKWPQWFDLTWQDGDYYRTDFKLMKEQHWARWFVSHPQAPKAINVKACMVRNVEPQDLLYATDEDSRSHSLVPGFGGRQVETGSSAFTLAKCGKGTVSFFGDVNAEEETMRVLQIVVKGEQG